MVERLIGLRGCGDDRRLVGLEDLQPVRDVAGMAFVKVCRQTQFIANARTHLLGHQLLESVCLVAETLAKLAGEPRGMARPMPEFMRFRRHEPVFGVEDIGVRKLNIISARRVERAVSAEAYVSRNG